MVGIFAGPYVGAIVGFASPIISTLLTGMPKEVMLPFMVVELFAYGLSAGLLRETSMPTFAKVLVSQVAGRVLRAMALAVSIYLIGNTNIAISTVWTSIPTGLIGLALQIAIIPLVVNRLESKQNNA